MGTSGEDGNNETVVLVGPYTHANKNIGTQQLETSIFGGHQMFYYSTTKLWFWMGLTYVRMYISISFINFGYQRMVFENHRASCT